MMRALRSRSAGTPPGHRGAVLMVALVCLVLALMVFGSLVRIGLARRGRVRMEERRLQAAWLAESGLERAAHKLAASADYQGETWGPSAADLGGRDGGVVRIAVEPVEGHPRRRLVRAVADYPSEPGRRARHSQQTMMDLGPEPTTGGGQ